MGKKLTSILIIIGICAMLITGCTSKTDLERLIGKWSNEKGTRQIKLYQPDIKGDVSGDLEFTKSDDVYYGTYKWRESSQRIVLSVRDNWGAIVDLSLDYEFVDDNNLILRETEDKSEFIELKRLE